MRISNFVYFNEADARSEIRKIVSEPRAVLSENNISEIETFVLQKLEYYSIPCRVCRPSRTLINNRSQGCNGPAYRKPKSDRTKGRAIGRVIGQKGKLFYAVPESELQFLTDTQRQFVNTLTVFIPIIAAVDYFRTLYVWRKKGFYLDTEQGIILCLLKQAPHSGLTLEELNQKISQKYDQSQFVAPMLKNLENTLKSLQSISFSSMTSEKSEVVTFCLVRKYNEKWTAHDI